MAVTLAQLKQRVRDNCYGPYPTSHPFVTTLGAAIATAGTTTITVADGDNWAVGDVLEVDETDEQCLVTAVATNDLTVIRAWNGTTAATAADGGVILKNPRFSKQQVTDALTSAIGVLELWGIFGFGTGQIAYDSTKRFIEVTDTDIVEPGVLALYYVQDNTYLPIPLPFRYRDNLSTAGAFSNAQGITVLDWGELGSGDTAEYTYAQRLTATTLSDSQAELVIMAAVAVVFGKSIIPRSQDPGARTDRTMPVGQEVRDSRWYQGEFFIRARAEAAYIAAQKLRLPGTIRQKRARRFRS